MSFAPKEKYSCISLFRTCLLAAAVLLLPSCAQNPQTQATDSKYITDTLAKDWREQVRKNAVNPYEDNDNEYSSPKVRKAKTNTPQKVYKYQYPPGTVILPPISDNEDSNYGKFPRYNPDDDNTYLDPKDYPLYME